MNYRFTYREDVQVLYIYRLLTDMDNRAILDEVNRAAHDSCSTILVELSYLEFMDSNGLNLLIALWRQAGQYNQKLYLTEPKASVIRLLEMTRLKAIFEIIPCGQSLPMLSN